MSVAWAPTPWRPPLARPAPLSLLLAVLTAFVALTRVATRYTYDDAGQITEMSTAISGNGYPSDATFTYNELGIATLTVPSLEQTVTSDDLEGRLDERRATQAGLTAVNTCRYDAAGALEEIVSYAPGGELGSLTTFRYDEAGALIERATTNASTMNGFSRVYDCDELGQLAQYSFFWLSDGEATPAGGSTLVYDEGRLVMAGDAGFDVELLYNEDGLVERIAYQGVDKVIDIVYGDGPAGPIHAPLPAYEIGPFIDHPGQSGPFDTDSISFYLAP